MFACSVWHYECCCVYPRSRVSCWLWPQHHIRGQGGSSQPSLYSPYLDPGIKLFSGLCGLFQKSWLCVLLGVGPWSPLTEQCSPSFPQQKQLVCPLYSQAPAPTIPLCALIFSSVLSVGAKLLPAPRKQGVVGWALDSEACLGSDLSSTLGAL